MSKYVYIDDEFYERINENSYTRYDWSDHIDIDDLRKIIEGLPTIEIVRCRECIHLQKNGQCDKTHLWIGNKEDGGCDDFFCGYGDRKE